MPSIEDTENAHDEDVVPSDKRLSPLDATIHLVKGNLGPGCLNLPHAFALAGWALGSGLFVFIAGQGIYSMWLLLYCKKLLLESHRGNDPDHHPPKTFMDVARASLGSAGGHLVELFLFVLQAGVCCVFLSLIKTNLSAFFPALSEITSVLIVTVLLMIMVLLRFIKDLLWLSATANALMITAILTATVAGLVAFFGADGSSQNNNIVVANPTPSVIITFTSDMFFSFEGIGLVLPVENSFGHQQRASFVGVLMRSMTLVAFLFVMIGVSASIGFPDIHSGSVTAYLEKNYPDFLWFSIVNALVIVAVAFTFPLQLTPAMEVLDGWIDHGCRKHHVTLVPSEDNDDADRESIATSNGDETFEDEATGASNSDHLSRTRCGCIKVWILRRWMVVLGCAVVVYLVDNLGLLMALFGAVGQTGLAGMPCAIHLGLQHQGIAPKSMIKTVVDVFILSFCAFIMVAGLAEAVASISG